MSQQHDLKEEGKGMEAKGPTTDEEKAVVPSELGDGSAPEEMSKEQEKEPNLKGEEEGEGEKKKRHIYVLKDDGNLEEITLEQLAALGGGSSAAGTSKGSASTASSSEMESILPALKKKPDLVKRLEGHCRGGDEMVMALRKRTETLTISDSDITDAEPL